MPYKMHEINKVTRTYILRMTDDMNDFTDINVEVSEAHATPKSKFFSHCELDYPQKRNRTIDEHVKFYKALIIGLEGLKEELIKDGADEYANDKNS